MATVLFCLAQCVQADILGQGSGGNLTPPTAAAGDPVIGSPDTTNCIPFGCADIFGITTYQQVYSSAAFTGVTPFNQISFFLSVGDELDDQTFTIHFSYTPAAVNGLSLGSPSDNIGSGEALFGTYTLSGPAPNTLVLAGNTFNYNPSLGNLLMTVNITGAGNSVISFEEADTTGAVTSRAYFGLDQSADSTGLVTGFNDASVPEPASIILLLTVVLWAGLRVQSNSAHTAAWSEAPVARRVSRSTSQARQRGASGAVARMWSMRQPQLWSKALRK